MSQCLVQGSVINLNMEQYVVQEKHYDLRKRSRNEGTHFPQGNATPDHKLHAKKRYNHNMSVLVA